MHNIYDNNENDNVGDCPRPHQDRLMIDTLMNGMDNLYSYYTVSSPSSVARIAESWWWIDYQILIFTFGRYYNAAARLNKYYFKQLIL